MQATARAQPNIALIKYWGKRDTERNLPAVGSISITLDALTTETSVRLGDTRDEDVLTVNGDRQEVWKPRVSACLDSVLGTRRPVADIESRSNFPIAAGLASSASAFAAVTVAAAAAAKQERAVDELARLAGSASGSAARSLYGGFVELKNVADEIQVATICDAGDWPLEVLVAITTRAEKAVGSTEAMEISRRTSPFYSSWLAQQDDDLAIARKAIQQHDFAALAAVAEHNCLKMHSVMWASRPPLVYWNATTMRCMETVRNLQIAGHDVFFTIDAGPQLKAVCLPASVAKAREALLATDGVLDVMHSGLGPGARLVGGV